MKKVERILIYVLAIGTIICLGLYFAPIKIYLMPINAWERQIWSGPTSTQKEENFVVYNHLFKSKQTLIDSIIAFHDRTIRLDSIKKYPDGYCRSFSKGAPFLINTIGKSQMARISYSIIGTNRFWQLNGELQEIRSAQISLAKIIKFLLQILPQYQYIAYPN